LLFEDGDTQILVDGYFSRPPLLTAAFGLVSPDCRRIGDGLRSGGITRRLRAIFVAHAHVDHALDAPEIAGLTRAWLVGSKSVRNIAIGHGLDEPQIRAVGEGPSYCAGGFRVTPILTGHSRPNIAKGDVDRPVPRRSWAQSYRSRDSHAFLIEHGDVKILVHPSAAIEPKLASHIRADVVFLGIAGLGRKPASFTDDYWTNVVIKTGAKLVYPVHWDNFGRPLGAGLRRMPWPFDNVSKGVEHVERMARSSGIAVREPPLFTPVPIAVPWDLQLKSRRGAGQVRCEILDPL
jgi:L-ascorbate metabolism protein UlaG (beta-lactamase superfamily)